MVKKGSNQRGCDIVAARSTEGMMFEKKGSAKEVGGEVRDYETF